MWNLSASNKLCSDKFTSQVHQKHLFNISTVKPSIDNRAPVQPEFLKNRQKQEKMKEIRAATIHYENKKLLNKMMDIERKPSSLHPSEIYKNSFHPTKTLHTDRKMRELKKITDENLSLMHRLQSAHSIYSVNKWIEDDKRNNTYKRNISQNASELLFRIFLEKEEYN